MGLGCKVVGGYLARISSLAPGIEMDASRIQVIGDRWYPPEAVKCYERVVRLGDLRWDLRVDPLVTERLHVLMIAEEANQQPLYVYERRDDGGTEAHSPSPSDSIARART